MEVFKKSKVVRLRSHLDKFLSAEENQRSIKQSRNSSSRKTKWTIEIVKGSSNSNFIRLKSCYGFYLAASEETFLLGMTGKKVLQTASNVVAAESPPHVVEWEVIEDGFQVKLRTKDGKYLRANGSTPPWRNSVTHDKPLGATKDWVLWDVEMVDDGDGDGDEFSRMESCVSSLSSDVDDDDLPTSIWSSLSFTRSSMVSPKLSMDSPKFSPRLSSSQLGMEFFRNAKAIRLKSRHDKYLLADDDEESVTQDRNGSSKRAKWTVEFIKGESYIRLKSCFNKYLTASNSPFLLGKTGHKVLQTSPNKLDSSLEWEPIREGSYIKLKTRYGKFLRANGGLPPWRNSVTHDVPQRTSTQDWVFWSVDVLEIQVQFSEELPSKPNMPDSKLELESEPDSPSVGEVDSSSSEPSTPSSFKSFTSSRFKPNDSTVNSSHKAVDGRIIYYSIIEDHDNVDDSMEEESFTFKGKGVDELTHKLVEEIGIEDIIVCTRSPLNGKLCPLRLQLPPNNATMHVVVVPSSSKVARDFA